MSRLSFTSGSWKPLNAPPSRYCNNCKNVTQSLPSAPDYRLRGQALTGGRYPDNLLRTLQRRVSTWRREMILEFDDGLTREDAELKTSLPPSLRGVPLTDTSPTIAPDTAT